MRIALSREGVFRMVGGRSLTEQRFAIGADQAGRFTAIVHTGTTVTAPHGKMPEPFIVATSSGYASASFKMDVEVARVDMIPRSPV